MTSLRVWGMKHWAMSDDDWVRFTDRGLSSVDELCACCRDRDGLDPCELCEEALYASETKE